MTTATVGKKNPKYKWEVLALLWVAYLLNQADRQVFNVVLPLIREDLGLSDVAIGSIATVFNLFYAVLVPIGGLVGDRFSRKWIVTGSILFWSVATMFTGLCNGFVMLVLMRSVATGGGEAFFGPANYSLLAQYHDKTRAFAMSVHQTAYYIGIIISGYAAGYIGQLWGWRSAFYVFGAVGVVHGVIMAVRLKDKKEPAAVAAASAAEPKPRLTEGFRMVFTTPTALILTVCFAGLIFVLTGYLTWMPTYLYENFGMDLAGAGFHSMFYTHLFAFVGVLLAGRLFGQAREPASRVAYGHAGLRTAGRRAVHRPDGQFGYAVGHLYRLCRLRLRPCVLRRQHLHGALRRHPAPVPLLGFGRDDYDRIRHRRAGSAGAGYGEAGRGAIVRHLDAGRRVARVRRGDASRSQIFLYEGL